MITTMNSRLIQLAKTTRPLDNTVVSARMINQHIHCCLVVQEIQLADVVKLEQAVLPAASQRSHYIFELHTVETIYYAGEDCEPNLNADDKGLGRQLGQWMETAIRQALLPVTPKASAEGKQCPLLCLCVWSTAARLTG